MALIAKEIVRAGCLPNQLAVGPILLAWFGHLEEIFPLKKYGSYFICLPVKTSHLRGESIIYIFQLCLVSLLVYGPLIAII